MNSIANSIAKIMEIQGNIKISLLKNLHNEFLADELASDFVQMFLDSKLLKDEVETDIHNFIQK